MTALTHNQVGSVVMWETYLSIHIVIIKAFVYNNQIFPLWQRVTSHFHYNVILLWIRKL